MQPRYHNIRNISRNKKTNFWDLKHSNRNEKKSSVNNKVEILEKIEQRDEEYKIKKLY